MLAVQLKNQLELENKEAERLKNLQRAVLIKLNMRKMIE